MSGQIRLACLYCDDDSQDGVDVLPKDWELLAETQSYPEACQEVLVAGRGQSVFDWYTHLGICPACQEVERDEQADTIVN